LSSTTLKARQEVQFMICTNKKAEEPWESHQLIVGGVGELYIRRTVGGGEGTLLKTADRDHKKAGLNPRGACFITGTGVEIFPTASCKSTNNVNPTACATGPEKRGDYRRNYSTQNKEEGLTDRKIIPKRTARKPGWVQGGAVLQKISKRAKKPHEQKHQQKKAHA